MASVQTLLWYDYETFGVDTRRDRPVQFAAIRTNLDLDPVDDPVDILCQPGPDTLPDPYACLVTGISPMKALQQGLPESEFARQIYNQMAQPNTCTLGYNSIRFDDEVSRFMFYRNLMDPYQREWKNGNSRWDLLDVVRLCWALKPDTLNWPSREDSSNEVSFKLDRLTPANGIGHENAHDAVSDVKATIDLARLVKSRQPELYDYAFRLRDKKLVLSMLDTIQRKPLLHISGRFASSQGCMAMVVPVCKQPGNPNAVLCVNLMQDPDSWMELDSDNIRDRLFSTSAELAEQGISRPGIKAIHVNKSPMLVPAAMLTEDIAERFGMDLARIRKNYDRVAGNQALAQKLTAVFEQQSFDDKTDDVDLLLYDGFIGNADRGRLTQALQMPAFSETLDSFAFMDKRLGEQLFRYWCRNWPDQIPDQLSPRWKQHCQKSLNDPQYGPPRTLESVRSELTELKIRYTDQTGLWQDIDAFLNYQQTRLD